MFSTWLLIQSLALAAIDPNPIEQIENDLAQLNVRHRVLLERQSKVQKKVKELTKSYHSYTQAPGGLNFVWEEGSGAPSGRQYVSSLLKSVLRRNLEELAQLQNLVQDLEAEGEWLKIQKGSIESKAQLAETVKKPNPGVFSCRKFPVAMTPGSTETYQIVQDFGVQKDADTGLEWKSNGWWLKQSNGDVQACASGKVAFVGEIKGRGWVVMLDHGDDVYTVYANIQAKIGQALKKGTLIREGASLGIGLEKVYFEVRVRGKAVDPRAVVPTL